MVASVGELILGPAIASLLCGLMGAVFVYGLGTTRGMKTIFRYVLLLEIGLFYSIAWNEPLSYLLGVQRAWIAIASVFAALSFFLCLRHLRKIRR